jgi:DNA-binding XRE family transcriptional regulator
MTFRYQYFKRLRRLRGFTLLTFAQKLGVSFQAVGFWEVGADAPNPKHIPKIAKILKIPAEDLFVFKKGEKP